MQPIFRSEVAYCVLLYIGQCLCVAGEPFKMEAKLDIPSAEEHDSINSDWTMNTHVAMIDSLSLGREKYKVLRKRDAESAADEEEEHRGELPRGLPRPVMHRWFPLNYAPPTDGPEVQEFENMHPQATLEPEELEESGEEPLLGNKSETKFTRMEAILQDRFAVEIEDGEQENEEVEQPLQPPRKSSRTKRDLRSLLEVHRRNQEIMRRRQAIIENEKRLRRVSTTQRWRSNGRTTQRTSRRPYGTRRTPTKNPQVRRTKPPTRTTQRSRTTPKPTRGGTKPSVKLPSPTKTTSLNKTQRTTSITNAPSMKNNATDISVPNTDRKSTTNKRPSTTSNTVRTPSKKQLSKPQSTRNTTPVGTSSGSLKRPTTNTQSTRNTTPTRTTSSRQSISKTQATRNSNPTRTSGTSYKRPTSSTSRPGNAGSQRRPSTSTATSRSRSNGPTQRSGSTFQQRRGGNNPTVSKRTKSTTATKKKGPNSQRRNSLSKPKFSVKSAVTVTVVRPVLLYNGQRTTTTLTRRLVRQNDSPQNRNNNPRLTFSKWSLWKPCKAKTCGTIGRQMRTRTCYGNNLTPADYAVCNYNTLVDHRQCRASSCTTTTTEQTLATTVPPMRRISRWSEWSKCSVTCGTGGQQTRTRLCYEVNQNEPDEMIQTNCQGQTLESRPCQYSVSCPMWDTWSKWSSCSKTCGTDGVSFRERKCLVERYVSFGPSARNGQSSNRPRQFDSGTGPKPTLREPVRANKKNAVKSSSRPPAKPKQAPRCKDPQGFLFLKKDGEKVFIVDAPRPQQDTQISSQRPVPDFHQQNSVKEFVDSGLCAELDGSSEQERRCVMERCPAEWGAWTEWSACSVTCGLGISRRERSCNGDSSSSSCIGRKYAYRRCYAAPCWGDWSSWSRCSISCGDSPGFQARTRNCLGATNVIPEYTFCLGGDTERKDCISEACSSSTWSNWGEYELCSASCNGGYQRRERTCLAAKCDGPVEDFARCNIQECPAWATWSMYSCCSVSCGQGTRKRSRTCANGSVGMQGCIGRVLDIEQCYRRRCGESSQQSVFTSVRCGVGSVSNLKKISFLRIFGGTRSSAHDWPWQVSWQHRESSESDWQHFCGAALLHPRWVITASHCTEESEFIVNHRNPGETWSVVVGMAKLYRDGKRYFVDRIFVHPNYEYKSVTKNDIALLKLRRMVPTTVDVMPVCMPRLTRPVAGETCYVTGWGYTTADPSASLSLSLREAPVPIMRFSQCRTLGDYYRYFLDSSMHMCAGNPVTASADSCTGDSGGPLVCSKNKRWYLAAVTSFGFADCGTPGHVGIYAPMDTYESWVRRTVEAYTYEKC